MAGVKYEFSYVFGEAFQPPQQQDWTLYRNTSFEFDLDVVDDQEQPVDLTGWCAELIIEYICAFNITPPGRGRIIKYKLIANRTTDTQYFNTKYGSFVVDDANGNIKFKLTSFGTSKDSSESTFFPDGQIENRLVQAEGPLLFNEAKYELRFKYTDPESNDDTYLRPLFGNITFVNTHLSTEDQLPCETKIDSSPSITSLEVTPAGDPNTYQSGDDLSFTKIIAPNSFKNFLIGNEKAYLYVNENRVATFSPELNIRLDSISLNVIIQDFSTTVVEGDEIKIVILKPSGQQLVTNTLIVTAAGFTPKTLYFNHNETTASWNKLEYWYEDENFQIPATELPRSIDSVIITSSVNFPETITINSLIVNGPEFGNPLIYKVPTKARTMTFNGITHVKSNLEQILSTGSQPSIIFNDYSEAGANISGTQALPTTILAQGVIFNDNSKNYADVNAADFYGNSENASATFYDNVTLTGKLLGLVGAARFYNNSKNYGIIGGRAQGSIPYKYYNTGVCKTYFSNGECAAYRSLSDKSYVYFYDNSCFVIDSTLSLDSRLPYYRYFTYADGTVTLPDTASVSPYPPPTCPS